MEKAQADQNNQNRFGPGFPTMFYSRDILCKSNFYKPHFLTPNMRRIVIQKSE